MTRAILGLVALLLAGCTAAPAISAAPTRTSDPSGTQTATPSPAAFGDGQHRVGVDIEPGTYRATQTTGDFCYWERVSGFGGSEPEVISNSAGVGPRVVTIAPSDAGFISRDCGSWTVNLDPLPGPIGDGVWIVGADLQPGRYRSDDATDLCLWERLSGFGGTSDEIVAVGSSDASSTVEIVASDRGFGSSRCGIWQPHQ